MTSPFKVGQIHEIEKVVTLEVTADYYGNSGVHVFATPALVALLEEAAVGCIASGLAEGEGSVGTHLEVRHLAATPQGMVVVGRAELVEVDRRRLVFKVEARDEQEQIASGTHERFVIGSMAKFLTRTNEKAK